jgi:hypothetical protein
VWLEPPARAGDDGQEWGDTESAGCAVGSFSFSHADSQAHAHDLNYPNFYPMVGIPPLNIKTNDLSWIISCL